MALKNPIAEDISSQLIEMIQAFPSEREVEHCGARFRVSPFDFYFVCPHCQQRIKLRGFSGTTEIEDIFDAVFEWMNRPETQPHVQRRRQELADEAE
jgi:hypothetical protein